MKGNVDNIGDQVPVDYCSHLIIAATAKAAYQNGLFIYHSASSSRNPITWIQTIRYFWPYVGRNRFERRLSDPSFAMYSNDNLYRAVFYLKRELPAKGFNYLARMIGNKKMIKDSERLSKAVAQCKKLGGFFGHFTSNEWIYDTYNMFELKGTLSDEDNMTYRIDVAEVDWKTYFPCFAYGIMKYLLKEEAEPPFGDRSNIIYRYPRTFADLSWVYYHGTPQKTHSHEYICKVVLNSEKVRMTIREIVRKELVASSISEAKILKVQHTRSREILDRMAAKMNHNKMRMLGYILHKAYKSMYEKVVINQGAIEELKRLNLEKDTNVVYCPTHRSYMDFLILTYVLYGHEIKVPHICAGEDFLNIAIVNTFLSNSGAFYMKRSFKGDPLYKSIFNEYVHYLASEGRSLEFFLEGTRARGGKMLKPRYGFLKILTDAYFQKKTENLYFVPVTVNYSRVLEGETFPLELLGESKVKESLSRILNTVRFIKMDFGSIYVEFTKPISFKSYVQQQMVEAGINPEINMEDRKLVTSSLAWQIINTLTDNLLIMPTSICASILLMHRKGISDDELTKQAGYLIKELKARNAHLPSFCQEATNCVKKGTFHLNETVNKKKDIFEPRVVPKVDYKNILLLAYYRNNLVHLFISEAIISCSMFGFGHHQAWQKGVTKEELWEKVLFISNLLRNEFVLTTNFKTVEDYEEILRFMSANKTIYENEDGLIVLHSEAENHINYLNSLIWPFIDTYWVTFTFIFSLVPSKFIRESEMMEKVQWFSETLYEDQIINFYESCSQEVIKNAIGTYFEDGIIIKQKLETISDGVKDPTVYTLGDEFNDEDRMQSFLNKLSHFRKATLVKMGNMTNIRKTLLSDFPFMAKM